MSKRVFTIPVLIQVEAETYNAAHHQVVDGLDVLKVRSTFLDDVDYEVVNLDDCEEDNDGQRVIYLPRNVE